MPIKIACPKCTKQYNVPDTASGKMCKCPQCGTARAVESGNVPRRTRQAPAVAAPGSAGSNNDAMYFLKTEDGQSFGPVNMQRLDEWFHDGRITAGCHIVNQSTLHTCKASDLYPQLDQSNAANPFAAAAIDSPLGMGNPRTGGADDGLTLWEVRCRVRTPAQLLMVIGILSVSLHVVSLAWQLVDISNAIAAEKNQHTWIIFAVQVVLIIGVPSLIAYGASQMLNRRNWVLAIIVSILAMIPLHICFPIGLIAGIWSLVVLLNQDVRAAFR